MRRSSSTESSIELLAIALCVAGCGYSFGPSRPLIASVSPITEPGVDVDAAALLATAVRHALARGPGTELAAASEDHPALHLELLSSTIGLQPFADPGLRAGQYTVVVTARASLIDTDGARIWESGVVSGQAPFLSRPGPIEQFEGARRRALEAAANDAAARLVAMLRWTAP